MKLFLALRDAGQLLEYVIAGARAVRFISGRKNAFQNIGGRRIYYAIRDKLPQEFPARWTVPSLTALPSAKNTAINALIIGWCVLAVVIGEAHNAGLAAPI